MKFRLHILTILFTIILVHNNCFAQNESPNLDQETIDWVKDLYQHGVEIISNDSVYISAEVYQLLNDDDYRSSIYKEQYSWQATIEYLEKNQIKKAVWNMINLYSVGEYHREKVVKSVLTFDHMFKMEEVLTSAFYTYCYTDPEIGQIVDGKPVVKAPHVLENKLNAVKEIIFYMDRYKAHKAD